MFCTRFFCLESSSSTDASVKRSRWDSTSIVALYITAHLNAKLYAAASDQCCTASSTVGRMAAQTVHKSKSANLPPKFVRP